MELEQRIKTLILKKEAQQRFLLQKRDTLENYHSNLAGSKFGRFFGTTYQSIKRVILILFSTTCFLLALFFFIYPDFLLEDETVREDLIIEYRESYVEMFDTTIGQTLTGLIRNEGDLTVDKFLNQLDLAFDKAIEEEIKDTFRGLGLLLVLFAVFLLYTSRLTKKIRARNRRLSDTETFVQEIITEFKEVIDSSEEELEGLKALLAEEKQEELDVAPEPSEGDSTSKPG